MNSNRQNQDKPKNPGRQNPDGSKSPDRQSDGSKNPSRENPDVPKSPSRQTLDVPKNSSRQNLKVPKTLSRQTLDVPKYELSSSVSKFRNIENPEKDLHLYLKGRVIQDVPLPLQHIVTEDELYGENDLPDIDLLRNQFHGEGRLSPECLMRVVTQAMAVLGEERNVVRVDGTVKVVGAVCGQFFDLLEILKRIDLTGGEKCVFLGKYAWDGGFSTETVVYLYALKVTYPEQVYLLRSQRETRMCAKTSFRTECVMKYSLAVYECFCRSFEHLPIAAIVNDDTFCIHGGFSPRALTLDEIDKIDRFVEPPPRGALTDMLWSDPSPEFGTENDMAPCFTFNEERFISVYFTYEAFKRFMHQNELSCLVRANQPLTDGYFEYPMLSQPWTERQLSMKAIFSTPNFKGKRNQGAMLTVTPDKYEVDKFLWVESPYWLPNFKDCFTWSVPFLVRKATIFVSDLLEFMDRDTAALDVKAALEKKQERSNVLSGINKDRLKASSMMLVSGTRQVVFSSVPEVRELKDEDYEDYDEAESEYVSEGGRSKKPRCRIMKILCCGAAHTEEEYAQQ